MLSGYFCNLFQYPVVWLDQYPGCIFAICRQSDQLLIRYRGLALLFQQPLSIGPLLAVSSIQAAASAAHGSAGEAASQHRRSPLPLHLKPHRLRWQRPRLTPVLHQQLGFLCSAPLVTFEVQQWWTTLTKVLSVLLSRYCLVPNSVLPCFEAI